MPVRNALRGARDAGLRSVRAMARGFEEPSAAAGPPAVTGELPMRAVGRGRTGAAVAIVLAASDARVLFVRRVVRRGDPWSGDVAFPGGLAAPGEEACATARREALEEVGLALGAPVGRLRDRVTVHPARPRPMRVRPFVFLAEHARASPDPREIAELFWVPLVRLRRLPVVASVRRVGPWAVPVPSIDLDGRMLWGLSLAIVRELRA